MRCVYLAELELAEQEKTAKVHISYKNLLLCSMLLLLSLFILFFVVLVNVNHVENSPNKATKCRSVSYPFLLWLLLDKNLSRKNAPLRQFWPPSMTGKQMVSLSDESDNFWGLVDWKWNIIKEKCALFSNYSFLLPPNSINEDSVLVKENHFLIYDLWAINLGCPSSSFSLKNILAQQVMLSVTNEQD